MYNERKIICNCNAPLIDILEEESFDQYELIIVCPHCGEITREEIFGKLRLDSTEYSILEKVDFNDGVYQVHLKVGKKW